MKRLSEKNINTNEEYNRIFFERQEKGVDSQDKRRWKKLLKYYKGGKLIDLGCLDSQIWKYSRGLYLGIDIAEEAIIQMQFDTEDKEDVYFEVRDLYDTKFPDNYFDYAVLGEVIEHLEKPEEAIKEAVRILKKGGTLAISTPLEEEKEAGAVDSERHLWSFNVDDLTGWLKPYGEVKSQILGSEYFPLYKYHWPSLLAYLKKK